MQRSWRYKISAVDSCGNESDMSPLHKTMHLTANLGINKEINLIWDHYEGFTYGTYVIYRQAGSGTLDSINALPSNLSSYTDLTPPGGQLYYQVSAIHPNGCTSLKMGKDYNTSRSNKGSVVSIGTMSVSASSTPAGSGVCDGEATAAVSGGDPPYSYQWDDPGSQATQTATGLCGSTAYSVMVTDSDRKSVV